VELPAFLPLRPERTAPAAPLAAEPPRATAATFIQLDSTSCRWPLWDGREAFEDQLYCGAHPIEGGPCTPDGFHPDAARLAPPKALRQLVAPDAAGRLLVAGTRVRDLLLRAKHLFVAAMAHGAGARRTGQPEMSGHPPRLPSATARSSSTSAL
jgi:hypothetical protein